MGKIQKRRSYNFLRMRKGLGNSGQHICCANASHKWLSAYLGGVMFPKWNPQSEFISDEENSKFQGIFMPMERAVYTYSNIVKILILTKGVETEFKKNVRKADCRNISYM